MSAIARFWFPTTAALLLSIIGFNVYIISRTLWPVSRGAEDLLPSRTITLPIAPLGSAAKVDSGAITNALQSVGRVKGLRVEEEPAMTVTLAVRTPVRLSALKELLKAQNAVVVERNLRLEGHLRLYVSGTT